MSEKKETSKEKNENELPKEQAKKAIPSAPETATETPVVEKVGEAVDEIETTAEVVSEDAITENDLALLKNASEESVFEELVLDKPEFKKEIEPSERAYYENIIKANKEAIKSLRLQLQEAHAKIEEVTKDK